MKIFDCFMFYDEEVLLDIRLNILNKFVDHFIIVESKYFHNGLKKLKFDINNYKKFRDKIIYIIHEDKPIKLEKINPEDNEEEKTFKLNFNAHSRENDQRNNIIKGLQNSHENDLILISDVDEIINLENTT